MPKACAISLETLLDWREGRLPSDAATDLQRHLETDCAACRESLQWLAATLPAVAEAVAPAPVPSEAALAYAKNLARLLRPVAADTGVAATVRKYVAYLVEGTGQRSLAAQGTRGGTLPAVQRVFETEAHIINVWDEPEEGSDHRYLIGQVYPHGENGAASALPFRSVALLPPGGAPETRAEREGSEFHFAQVAPGVYLIRCLLENEEVIVPQVEVGLP